MSVLSLETKRIPGFKLLCLLGALAVAGEASACPCGCGTANPQVMFPGETWKVSAAVSRQSGFEAIDPAGRAGEDAGPAGKEALTMALSRALGPRASATLTAPYQRNVDSEAGDDTAAGDPTLSGRLTVVQADFGRPSVPQVQAVVAYKRSVSRSLRESDDEQHLMDVHGNGFDEVAAGADLWWTMTAVKWGAAALVTEGLEESFPDVTVRPGRGLKLTGSAGYAWVGTGQVVGQLERETQAKMRVDGDVVPDSDRAANGAALLGTLSAGPRRTIGLTLKRTAFFGGNKNTTRSDSLSLAYTVAL